ncbi:MAG: polymer-forming cytoskeletal protein [Rhodospirillales bacterium]
MFRKKTDEPTKSPDSPGKDGDADDTAAPPLKPFSSRGTHAPAKPPASAAFHPEVPRRPVPDIPGMAPRRLDRSIAADADSKKLVIGRDICLAGEITSCDKLMVEGRAEVQLSGARIIEVAPSGLFKGAADVEEADISGRYEGELIARGQLVVRTGGRISGTIRYGRIIIESGGEISGDMQTLDGADESEDPAPADAEPAAAATPKRKRGGAKAPAARK